MKYSMMNIRYETVKYDWLCFKHAVEQANKGFDVQTEIVTDIENYMGSTYCPRCKEEMEDVQVHPE